MLQKKLMGAIFSLDPVGPDKPYHPFNSMRFAPSQLCDSELLNTMLLTDYTLKFLTTGQEVQGRYPFQQRPIDSMIKHLPAYLRKIIEDFHQENHPGATHRFWIEAEEIAISLPDAVLEHRNIARIGLDNIRMVVKKHRMERDIHGELKDAGDENEGWPIYVLTTAQFEELQSGYRQIKGRAMIFIYAETKLFYWENDQLVQAHSPEGFRETLIRLYRQPKTETGKIEPSSQNSALLYRITRTMAEQTRQPHHYSPEYIFAHLFTTHYDEFAQYLPEFGRLKELSKMATLVRFLNGLRKSNKEHIQALNYLVNDSSQAMPPTTEVYRKYNEGYQKSYNHITSIFQRLGENYSIRTLKVKWREQIASIKNQIGELNFTSSSPEIRNAKDEYYRQLSAANPGAPSYRIWEVVNRETADLPSKLSEVAKKNCRTQLDKLFGSFLNSTLSSYEYHRVMDSFMQGNITPLVDALAQHESAKTQQDLSEKFKATSTENIHGALEGNDQYIDRIARDETLQQLREQKANKENIAAGFTRIGFGKDKKPVDLKLDVLVFHKSCKISQLFQVHKMKLH